MEAKPEVGASDDARVVFRFEPASAKLNPPRGQTGKTALEFGSPVPVAGDEHHQVGKPTAGAAGFPVPYAMFEIPCRIDHQIEVLVGGPAGRTDDEPERRGVTN